MLLNGKRIFMVDDNAGNNAVMQLLLEWQGAKTVVDRWADDTIDRLRAFAPVDIILLDLMLPRGVTGFDIFDRISEIPDFIHIPIVAVSAMDASVAVPRTRAKGFAGFIAKPINYDLFPQQIAEVIKGKQVWHVG